MPLIISRGSASSIGFGRGQGESGPVLAQDTSVRHKATNPTFGALGSASIPLLSNYAAGIRIYLVGDGGNPGPSCCGNCGRSSSGENASFLYTCTGLESGLTVTWNGTGTNNTDNYHEVLVNGGPNNGSFIRAGGLAGSYGYGNSCPPASRVGESSGVFTLESSGAYAESFGNYYNDDYYYSPCGSSYGNGLNGLNIDSVYAGYSGGCSPGAPGAVWLQYLNNY